MHCRVCERCMSTEMHCEVRKRGNKNQVDEHRHSNDIKCILFFCSYFILLVNSAYEIWEEMMSRTHLFRSFERETFRPASSHTRVASDCRADPIRCSFQSTIWNSFSFFFSVLLFGILTSRTICRATNSFPVCFPILINHFHKHIFCCLLFCRVSHFCYFFYRKIYRNVI